MRFCNDCKRFYFERQSLGERIGALLQWRNDKLWKWIFLLAILLLAAGLFFS